MRLRLVLLAVITTGCGAKTGFGDEGVADRGEPTAPTASAPSPRPRPTPAPPAPTSTPKPGPSPSACTNVTGLWAGTWTSAGGASGTWETNMVEAASGALSGTSRVTGTSCGTSSAVVGQREACSIRFGLADFAACQVDFTGTLSGDVMAGTFAVSAGVSDRGEWSGSKQ